MIKLKFYSPSLLNSLSDTSIEEAEEWYVFSSANEKMVAVLDLKTMRIQGENNDEKSAFLKQMFVNENEHIFYFEHFDNALKLDFPFASSMLGQLLKGKDLIDALKGLNAHYGAERAHDELIEEHLEKDVNEESKNKNPNNKNLDKEI